MRLSSKMQFGLLAAGVLVRRAELAAKERSAALPRPNPAERERSRCIGKEL